MTVIAWDGKTLAADKLSNYGDCKNKVTKIRRIGSLLVGGAGESAFIAAMFEWVQNGRAIDQFPRSQADKDDWQPIIVIEADGSTSIYERTPYPVRYEQEQAALGSGRDFARAAMHLGKTAREAVELAIELCPSCGMGVDALEWRA